jgi:hypothetical protein
MEYIITESKLFNAIYRYLDSYLNPSEMDWVYGYDEDEDGYKGLEDENFLMFFKGEWNGEDDTDIVFYYFGMDYYSNSESFRNNAPILEVMGKYAEHLDTIFDNLWKEPMKKWVQDNFNLPVKSVSTHY